jgi:hypothetical protein
MAEAMHQALSMRLWTLEGMTWAWPLLLFAALLLTSVILFAGLYRYTVCQGGGFCMTCKTGDSYIVTGNCIEISNTKFCGDYNIEDRRK